jgi:ABC-type sugar transport system substrate-binding protein
MKCSRWLVPTIASALVFAAAGCGGDDEESSSSGTSNGSQSAEVPAELQQIVDEGSGTISEWPGPTEGPVAESGKFVVSIPCARVAYGCARIDDGVKAAGKALGWRVLSVDAKGSPDTASQAIQQAIDQKADGIVLGAMDPALVKGAIADAREAGIPVVDPVAAREPSPTGINHDVKIHGDKQGELLGAYIATESGGKAKVGIMDDEEFPHQALRTGGIKKSLEQCEGCEIVGQSNFVVTDIGTQLGPKSQAFLQANPEIDWLSVAFDAAASDVVVANQQAGARKVNIVSMDANPQNIDFIEQGKQTATVGAPLDWAGWAAVDNINRIISGEEPLEDDGIPSRLVTKDNVADFKENGYGPVDYEAKYTELWKSGKTTK